MTKYHSFDRIDEAHFLIDRNIDPYSIEHIFQVKINTIKKKKPILIYFFYLIRDLKYLKMILFLLSDLLISETISS